MLRKLQRFASTLLLAALLGCAASLDRAVDGLEHGAVAVAVLGDEAGKACAEATDQLTQACEAGGEGPECYDRPVELATRCESGLEDLTEAQAKLWEALQLLRKAQSSVGHMLRGGGGQ